MKLYLMRHGDAEPKNPIKYFNDADRPLTAEGKQSIRAEAELLKRQGFRVELILTSPYLRARQTAQIMAEICTDKNSVRVEPLLEPGFNFEDLQDILRENKNLNSLLLVGHAPDLGNVKGQLLGESPADMKKGDITEFEIDPPSPKKNPPIF